MQPVERWSDVPAFSSEEEEHRYWSTHELAGEALQQMKTGGSSDLPAPRAFKRAPRTRPIAIRLDADVLRRIKAVASRKNKGYQTLLKEFVVERLYEEEKREGLLAG
jgi:predicted DNA binding CopG/RHH family protein